MKTLVAIIALTLAAIAVRADTLTVTIPNNVSTNVVQAVANANNYANLKKQGESRKEFVERLLFQHLKALYLETKEASKRTEAATETNTELPNP